MEGDAFSNREISRPEVINAGAVSPPYRPLETSGDNRVEFGEPLDITALQSILAAELAARDALETTGSAHHTDDDSWSSPVTPEPGTTPQASACSQSSLSLLRPQRPSVSSGIPDSPNEFGGSLTQSPEVVSLLVNGDGTVSTAQVPASVTSCGDVASQGDIVGSENPDTPAVLPADTLEEASWRIEPETVHPTISLKRNFAWNPWTKTYVPLEESLKIRRLWCWQPHNLNWWTAFLFLLGSIGFFYGAIWAAFRSTHSHPELRLYQETLPYLAGGLCFVAGAVTLTVGSAQLIDWDNKRGDPAFESLLKAKQYGYDESHTRKASSTVPGSVSWLGTWEVAPAPGEGPLDQPVTLPRRESSGVRIMWRVAAEDEFQRLWSEHDPWTRRKHIVEVAGSFIIFIGTLFYKVSLFSDLFSQVSPYKIPPQWQWALLVGSLEAGSTAFVIGGYLLCAAYESSWLPWRLLAVNPFRANLSWWIVILNMAGSLLFLLGAMPLVTPGPTLLSPSYVQNLLGWACGSLLFFAQSWLMIIEVATAEDNESPDDEFSL